MMNFNSKTGFFKLKFLRTCNRSKAALVVGVSCLIILILNFVLAVPFLTSPAYALANYSNLNDTDPFMILSSVSGPTGTVVTIQGKVADSPGHNGGCGPLAITDTTGDALPFGETCWHNDGMFSWHGPLPREGVWLTGSDSQVQIKTVPIETVEIGFYLSALTLPTSATPSAEFTITDDSEGPYADNFPDGKFILLDHFVAMRNLWHKSDQLVASGQVKRSWLWGPAYYTTFLEPYAEGSNGWRYVRYYDKTRMEVTLASALLPTNPYYVTNGLLVREMVTGQLQLGDKTFQTVNASSIPVAGDLDKTNPAPGFVRFEPYQNYNPYYKGELINRFINGQSGEVKVDPYYNKYNVRTVNLVGETQHFIATVFWDYLNTSGPLLNNEGSQFQGKLFDPIFFATGLPITEAFWTKTRVSGAEKDVLVQLFERRVLTYTPANPVGFQVEMGNTGLQYYHWRYD